MKQFDDPSKEAKRKELERKTDFSTKDIDKILDNDTHPESLFWDIHSLLNNDCVDMVKALINARPSLLNVDVSDEFPPLVRAAGKGCNDLVEWMIEKGASPNQGGYYAGSSDQLSWRKEDGGAYTALDAAIAGDHPEVLQQLVEAGAEFDEATSKPIEASIEHESTDVLELLVAEYDDIFAEPIQKHSEDIENLTG